jgi:hypothetical protein
MNWNFNWLDLIITLISAAASYFAGHHIGSNSGGNN